MGFKECFIQISSVGSSCSGKLMASCCGFDDSHGDQPKFAETAAVDLSYWFLGQIKKTH